MTLHEYIVPEGSSLVERLGISNDRAEELKKIAGKPANKKDLYGDFERLVKEATSVEEVVYITHLYTRMHWG